MKRHLLHWLLLSLSILLPLPTTTYGASTLATRSKLINNIQEKGWSYDNWEPFLKVLDEIDHGEHDMSLEEIQEFINVQDNDQQCSALIFAVREPIEAMKKLLKLGADTELSERFGATPLLYAAEDGREDATQLLLDYKADPNNCTTDGESPLLIAIQKGHVPVVGSLLNDPVTQIDEFDGVSEAAVPFAQRVRGVALYKASQPYAGDHAADNDIRQREQKVKDMDRILKLLNARQNPAPLHPARAQSPSMQQRDMKRSVLCGLGACLGGVTLARRNGGNRKHNKEPEKKKKPADLI